MRDSWYDGQVVLANDSRHHVKLRYNGRLTEGLLQVKENDRIYTLNPDKVTSFSYYDSARDEQRSYISMPIFIEYHQHAKKLFMEVLHEGNSISLLRRTDVLNPKAFVSNRHKDSNKTKKYFKRESLYLLDHSLNRIYNFKSTSYAHQKYRNYSNADKKLLFGMMGHYGDDVKAYASLHKIKVNSVENISRLLDHYHRLADHPAITKNQTKE
ncbi:hypothetical protein QQ008_00935 [Fulvivirgaceae bacterium BMA10]|uniref:Uncharacterized protein n=2 Tax=Splendidivirga corallicola TaxID=3051826 RepID=A0ABT8KGS0_9BACT|nr:hypothetical protein [Fulvivirgaceae bacterium BMA10]